MNLSKQQAIDIIEREPVGGAHYYLDGKFYSKCKGMLFVFDGNWWVDAFLPLKQFESLTPMHELLAIAEGED